MIHDRHITSRSTDVRQGRWGPLALLVLAAASCAVNPATGRRQLSLIGEGREVDMGRTADRDIAATMGIYRDSALAAYVDGLGRSLAARSERPGLPWQVRVIDDPAVNAFALPGGFLYVTRGILAHLESEAELAGVLGHEIGHVTARHSVSRMSRRQLQSLGLGLGMALSRDVRRVGGVVRGGLELLDLRYSRGDEAEADELGVRYMSRAGFDPHALVGVFRTLSLVSGGEEGRLPEWQSTHPYPENREARIQGLIDPLEVPAARSDGRDRFLERIRGLVYGDDPRQGYFEGAAFFHPGLAFSFTFPRGWKTRNTRSAVVASDGAGGTLVVVTEVRDAGTAERALADFLASDAVTGGRPVQETLGGEAALSALFEVTDGGRTLRGEAVFVDHGGTVMRVLGAGDADGWARWAGVVRASLRSFRRVTDPRVLERRPDVLDIVRVPRAMTVSEFHEAYPSVVPLEEVARINRLQAGVAVPRGTSLKRVVRGG